MITAEEPDLPHITSVEAIRVVFDFLKGFRPREYAVIRDRIIDNTSTLEQLGAQFDVTRERIRQIERRLQECLEEFRVGLEGPWVRYLAKKVRDDLGTAVPAQSMAPYFRDLCSSIESDEDRTVITGLVLWLAGPYESYREWRVTDPNLASATVDALIASRDSRGWLSPECTTETLLKAGIEAGHHASWMRTIGFFEMEGGWLLQLNNIPDRVEQILRYRGEPVTAEVLFPLVDCENVRSLRSRLLENDRFKRTTKQGHFALREWSQYDEYSGIADEIAEEITRQGGVADAQYLIELISQRYGVKAGSVHQYLSAPMFMKVAEGRVRLRAPDEMRTVRSDPRLCPGLYRIDEQWVLRVKITGETLRGSGRPVHSSVAALVGCQPGERRVFKSPRDEIVVSWPPGSASGPNLGSLRPDVEALGGAVDDHVFLTFGAEEIGVRLLKAAQLTAVSNDVQLALLVGLPGPTPDTDRWTEIASAIGLRVESQATSEDVHAWLMRRNEVALARLINMPSLQDPQEIFAQLENTLWR